MSELSLYDIVGTEGVATDISHINTGAKVQISHSNAPQPANWDADQNISYFQQEVQREVQGTRGQLP